MSKGWVERVRRDVSHCHTRWLEKRVLLMAKSILVLFLPAKQSKSWENFTTNFWKTQMFTGQEWLTVKMFIRSYLDIRVPQLTRKQDTSRISSKLLPWHTSNLWNTSRFSMTTICPSMRKAAFEKSTARSFSLKKAFKKLAKGYSKRETRKYNNKQDNKIKV